MIERWIASLFKYDGEPTERIERRQRETIATGLTKLSARIEPGKRYTLIVGEWQERSMPYGQVELSIEMEIFTSRPAMMPPPNFFTEKPKDETNA